MGVVRAFFWRLCHPTKFFHSSSSEGSDDTASISSGSTGGAIGAVVTFGEESATKDANSHSGTFTFATPSIFLGPSTNDVGGG